MRLEWEWSLCWTWIIRLTIPIQSIGQDSRAWDDTFKLQSFIATYITYISVTEIVIKGTAFMLNVRSECALFLVVSKHCIRARRVNVIGFDSYLLCWLRSKDITFIYSYTCTHILIHMYSYTYTHVLIYSYTRTRPSIFTYLYTHIIYPSIQSYYILAYSRTHILNTLITRLEYKWNKSFGLRHILFILLSKVTQEHRLFLHNSIAIHEYKHNNNNTEPWPTLTAYICEWEVIPE